MTDSPIHYVSGYACPRCNVTNVGVEIRERATGRIEGWQYRVPVTDDLCVQCFNCRADVPREHWTLQR